MKNLIIIILIVLSFTCNGQNRFKKEFKKADSSFNMKDHVIKNVADPDSTFNDYGNKILSSTEFKEWANSDSIKVGATNTITTGGFYLGSTTIIDSRVNILDRNVTIDLLLEYKKECFNDSVLVKVNINPDRNTTNGMGGTTCMYYPPKWVDKWQRKKPSFPDFLNWIEKRKTK